MTFPNPIDNAFVVRARVQRARLATCATRLTTARLLLRIAESTPRGSARARWRGLVTRIADAVDVNLEQAATRPDAIAEVLSALQAELASIRAAVARADAPVLPDEGAGERGE